MPDVSSNALIYEADLSALNPFRDALVHPRATTGVDGCVGPSDGPGLGIEVDESLFEKYPGIPGPCYVCGARGKMGCGAPQEDASRTTRDGDRSR